MLEDVRVDVYPLVYISIVGLESGLRYLERKVQRNIKNREKILRKKESDDERLR